MHRLDWRVAMGLFIDKRTLLDGDRLVLDLGASPPPFPRILTVTPS